ncbi:SDR family NAD(P)-dependent oxidoreductase [Iamia majanohamensis]|uniref:SDR family NAD(P)-dependent oxidoreductase n=1 Tax=Iamia majanohamensis TaxID=467976 RepID=A0AAF0BWZ3_9ACTN|nr:SDR family oxidoreductase [Iamia majanohamensis]WCO68410.1 SDR family NAD(P)-dependent oxidoreductase [Iamia majanohamensis]
MTLDGTTCIITGAARGIGFALADRFLAEGATGVAIADLDPADCADAAARLAERHGDRVLDHAADVSDQAEVEALVARTEERFGPVGLFAANAGVGTAMGLDADDVAWDRTWRVNVMAHVVAARVVVPAMVERGGGTFLTTASAAGLLSQIGDAAYSVTKHGAVAFAEWLSITYGDQGLRVHCLCPQGVNTDMIRGGADTSAVSTVALQGVIEPEEVAQAVVAAMDEGHFLVLPHPEVATYAQRRAGDPDRWLKGMRKLQALVLGGMAGG